MLTRDQTKRIKAHEILQHPWLNEEKLQATADIVQQPVHEEAFGSNSKANFRTPIDLQKPKTKNLHDEISKNLSESFRRSSRDPAITLVVVNFFIEIIKHIFKILFYFSFKSTALDKQSINAMRTPTLDKVDENNEDF